MSAATTMSKLDKVSPVEAAALSAWQTYHRQAEPLSIDFGAKLLALRNEISARGKDGEGFAQWLKTHDIPRSTAYHCIARYEESIGLDLHCAHCGSTDADKLERMSEVDDRVRTGNSWSGQSTYSPRRKIWLCGNCIEPYVLADHNVLYNDRTAVRVPMRFDKAVEMTSQGGDTRMLRKRKPATATTPAVDSITDAVNFSTAAPAVATRLEVVDDGSGVVQYIETPDETPVDAAAAFTTELLNDECAAEDYFLNDPKSKTWLPFGIKCNNPQRAAATRTYQISFGGFEMLTVAQVRLLADTLRTAGISCRPPLSMVRTKTLYYDTETGEVQDPPPHHGVRRDAASLMGAHIKPVAATAHGRPARVRK